MYPCGRCLGHSHAARCLLWKLSNLHDCGCGVVTSLVNVFYEDYCWSEATSVVGLTDNCAKLGILNEFLENFLDNTEEFLF